MKYPDKSYYDTLGIPRNATYDQIKSAYRAQIKFFHPDVFSGNPEIAKEKSLELNEAYRILSNPEERKKYDDWLQKEDFKQHSSQNTHQEQQKNTRQQEQQSSHSNPEEDSDPDPEPEANPEPDPESKSTSKDVQKDDSAKRKCSNSEKRYRIICSLLAVALITSLVVGAFKLQQLNDAIAKSEADRTTLLAIIDESSSVKTHMAYYKESADALLLVEDLTFNFLYNPGIYLDGEGAGEYCDTVDAILSQNLYETTIYYEACLEYVSDTTEQENLSSLYDDIEALTASTQSDLKGMRTMRNSYFTTDFRNRSTDNLISATTLKNKCNSLFWDLYGSVSEYTDASMNFYTEAECQEYAQLRVDDVFKEMFSGQTNPFTGRPIENEQDYRQYQEKMRESEVSHGTTEK